MSRESLSARSGDRWLLGGLLALALFVRGAWGWVQPADEAALDKLPDQREYLVLAQNLSRGQGLKFDDARFSDEVYAFRTPGYPLFLAALGAKIRLIRLVQALIDTSTVLAVYLLARQWLSLRAALLAAALAAVNPFLIYFTALVLTETLFTAMLAWGMLLLVGAGNLLPQDRDEDDGAGETPAPSVPAAPRKGATLWWLAGGLVLALSVLVRQSAAGLPVVLGIAAAFVNRRRGAAYHRRWPLPVGTTMMLLTALVLMPWAYRNSRVLGSWVWTTTNGGITAYDGFSPDATGASDQSFVESMPELRRMDELGRSQYLSELAQRFVREQPRRALELAAIKAARTWSPAPRSADYSGLKYKLVGLLYSLPLDLLALAGLITGRLPRAAKVFLLLPAIYFTGVHMLSVGSLRYRIPVEPPMAVIAASLVAPAAPVWKRATR